MSDHDRTKTGPVSDLSQSHADHGATADAPTGTFAQTLDHEATSAQASLSEFPTIPGYTIVAKLGEGVGFAAISR